MENELDTIVENYHADNLFLDKRQVRVLEFCKRKQASHYINTEAGAQLYPKDIFRAQDLTVSFVRSKPITYY